MKTVEFEATLSIAVLTISFSCLIAGFIHNNVALVVVGAVGVIGSIIIANHVYRRLKKKEDNQEKREQERHDNVISELRGFREDMNKR